MKDDRKELRITLRARNNRLIAAREELGLGARDAAARIPISYHVLLDLEGLKLSPLNSKGAWRESAVRIAAHYGCSPEYFWPEAIMSLVEPEKTVEIDAMDVARLGHGMPLALADAAPSPFDDLAAAEEACRLDDMLRKACSPREHRIVRWRFGLGGEPELSHAEIADKYNLPRTSIVRVEQNALHRLRRFALQREIDARQARREDGYEARREDGYDENDDNEGDRR